MRGDPAVVIQISDNHLVAEKNGNMRGVVTFDTLAAVLDQIETQYPQANAYAVTGDLSHDGSPGSYRIMKELLGGVDKPVYVIPGNHDDVDNMRRFLLAANIQAPAYMDIGDWRLIFLNTQVAGEEYGYLDAGEMKKLSGSLVDGPLNRLICIHHPAVSLASDWIDRSMLRNREELFEVLSGAQGNFVVLCGHAHQEYVKQVNAVTLMGAPSTCTQFKPRTDVFELDDLAPGFRVIELDDSGGFGSRVVRLGSA